VSYFCSPPLLVRSAPSGSAFLVKREQPQRWAPLPRYLGAFAFLTKFKRFKGLGFEGELWEQEMEQAAELRRGLEGLAEQLGEAVVWQTTPRGRGFYRDRSPFQNRLAIVERATETLRGIGISPQRIDELKRPWHKFVMFDLARPIVRGQTSKNIAKANRLINDIRLEADRRVADGLEEKTPREIDLETQLHCLEQERIKQDHFIWRDDYENLPRLLRQFIDESVWLSPEDRQATYRDRSEEFLDIDQYARERTVRRPDVLDQSRDWR
jgi:hypothetical protein